LEDKKLIYRILNLEKGEGILVTLPVIYSFFAGASLAFFVTSSTSLFLNLFERDMLSIAFIAAGIIVWAVGQIFSKVQKSFTFTKSITSGLAFLVISILIFTAFFIGSRPLVVVFIIYAWVRVFAYIHAVTFWGMAGRLFTLRQGKRLFGLISGGEVIASILSFFSVPLLLKLISTEDLLFISGATLLVGFFIMLIIVRKFSDKLASSDSAMKNGVDKKELKKTSFLKNKYYKLFFLIAFIPIFAQFFVDFIFQAQAKIEYPSKEELTAFVGVFFGISSIVEFFLKTFISGRLMSRYGMRFGLLAFPVVLAFSFILATTFGLVYGAASLFFSFVALGRLFTRAVRTSFNDPATQILYQPLPPDERIAFQNKVESGPKAYASIVAGILLFLFAKIPGFSLVYFAAFLLVIIAIWYRSAIAIYKEYRDVLQSILSKKGKEIVSTEESKLLQLLKNTVESTSIYESRSLIYLFRQVIPYEVDKFISENEELSEKLLSKTEIKFSSVIELSKSENSEDRIIAATNMTKYSIYKVEKPIVRLLHDDNFRVKCEAVISSGKMKESELFYHLISLFQNPNYKDIVSAAMINIGEAIVPDLDHNFQKTEYDVIMQLRTVELVEKIGGKKSIDFLKRNINHHNKLVSDRISKALGKLNFRAHKNNASIIWQKLENEIKNYVSISSALLNIGQQNTSTNLYKTLSNEQVNKKQKIFSHLSVLYDPKAIGLIEESLELNDKNASGFALEVADMVLTDMHKPFLLPLLENQFNFEIVNSYMHFFPTESLGIVEQLIDIINSEYWVTGFYTKCCALEMLFPFKNERINNILIANMVHPNEMIWQLAAYYLYHRDKELFYKEVNQNFPKVNGLKEFSEQIEEYNNGSKKLIYKKLLDLKKLNLFDKISEEILIEIAASAKEMVFNNDDYFQPDQEQTDFYIISSGEIVDESGEKILTANSAFCPFLIPAKDVAKYRINSDASIIKVKMHYITSLMNDHKEFAKELMKAMVPKEQEQLTLAG
jgi:AAA family ATP:ADP antiporter